MQLLREYSFLSNSDRYLGAGLPGCIVNVRLIYLKTAKLFAKVTV